MPARQADKTPYDFGYETKGTKRIMRYRHKNFITNGTMSKRSFEATFNIIIDYADWAIANKRDSVFNSSDNFVIAAVGIHKTTTWTQHGGHNDMADETEHVTLSALLAKSLDKNPFGPTGHIKLKLAKKEKDARLDSVETFSFNPLHKNAQGVTEPISWFPGKQFTKINGDAIRECFPGLKFERTPSPELQAPVETRKEAAIPEKSAWGAPKTTTTTPAAAKSKSTVADLGKKLTSTTITPQKAESSRGGAGNLPPSRSTGRAAERSSRPPAQDATKEVKSRSRSRTPGGTRKPTTSSTTTAKTQRTAPPPAPSSASRTSTSTTKTASASKTSTSKSARKPDLKGPNDPTNKMKKPPVG
ncbi:hypothetical protein SBOR_7219 [Sclerotinia borealis F-4128]|uniref:Uncharacterized protein n=1 Tax=Sclerotinia borealis (strain F-4128) TaxID=1432307 RepID=W9C990_SCLBF|nr:hypothetical protein SBOR_7219 [Sclerotinia borealis F-4128]